MCRLAHVALAIVASGCFVRPSATGDRGDGGATMDALPCTPAELTCDGTNLHVSCTDGSESSVPCAWGCKAAPQPHCGALSPSGGGVVMADLDPTGLSDVELGSPAAINSSDGSISGTRPDGEGIAAGIGFGVSHSVGVFRFKSLHVTGNVDLIGTDALALVADGPIVIDGHLNGTVNCMFASVPPPGGRHGGAPGLPNTDDGAGGNGTSTSQGGGGGGDGGTGGAGGAQSGTPPAGGAIIANSTIIELRGGGGGGGGGDASHGGPGGSGGAAIQLVSNTSITINAGGGINAGGCGGKGFDGVGSGGGGGAGGAILFEAPAITIAGPIAVNGGGGGADAASGSPGLLSRTPAGGGLASAGGIRGGSGAAGATSTGADGTGAQKSTGGGGGIGWIRLDLLGSPAISGVMSPMLGELGASQGPPAIQ